MYFKTKIKDLMSLGSANFFASLIGALFWLYIAKILDKLLLPLKNYSLLFGLLLVQACNPMTVAPPFDSKDAITLACNDQGGAVISNIRQSFDGIVTPFGGKFKTQFFGEGDLTYTDGFGNERDGPGVFGEFFIWPIAFILIEYWLDKVFSDKF